jgi:hypothetical protein
MKKQLLTIGAVALATLATQQAAHATLTTVSDGTATFNSAASGTISVGFDVVYDSTSSLYTYLYEFTPLANSPIGQFTVNAQYVSSVLTTADSFSGSPYTLTGSITSGGTLPYTGIVSWNYNPYTTAEQLVGFTSVDGPGNGSGSLNDGQSGPWGDNATGTPIPVPVPVPEASTVLAGALMLLPFGIGAIRSLRKERAV